jgi:pyruvate/2-oxoglutarate dehydrogenase complex dihydrolipoamide acyltransferase (E2) component
MRVAIELPSLGDETEGRVSTWLKAVGETVEAGEAIVEIETDKATIELEAPASGRLVEILCEAGRSVTVGGVLGYLVAGAEAAS